MSHHQTLTLDKRREVCIETPEGLIRIKRGHRNKLILELPDPVKAYVGYERTVEHARFIRELEGGGFSPRFQVLVPVMDLEGRLQRVETPTVFRIGSSNGQPDRNKKVADVAGGGSGGRGGSPGGSGSG